MPRGDGDFSVHPENAIHVGRPKESAMFRKLKKCSQEQLLTAYWKVCEMTKEEMMEFSKDEKATLLEIGLVKRMLKGDIDIIMNRILGMPKQPIESDNKLEIIIRKASEINS